MQFRRPETRVAEHTAELRERMSVALGVAASIINENSAEMDGVSRSSLGTNSNATARPPDRNDLCTLRNSVSFVFPLKWCKKIVSSTMSYSSPKCSFKGATLNGAVGAS